MSDIIKRVLVAVALIALLASVLMFGGIYQLIVISLAAMLSVYELSHALLSNGHNLCGVPAYLFAALFYLCYSSFDFIAVFILWIACVMLVCVERVLNRKRATVDALISLALMVYPVAFYAVLMLLAEDGSFEYSRIAFLSAFAMPLMGDTLAFCTGKLFGKRKLCVEISPNKTVAGAIGGVMGGAVGGALVCLAQLIWDAGVGIFPLIALGLLCGVVGQFGDLFASCIKRYAGVKDYGNLLPGHGGMTDRLDSVLFCAPLIYAAFTLWS